MLPAKNASSTAICGNQAELHTDIRRSHTSRSRTYPVGEMRAKSRYGSAAWTNHPWMRWWAIRPARIRHCFSLPPLHVDALACIGRQRCQPNFSMPPLYRWSVVEPESRSAFSLHSKPRPSVNFQPDPSQMRALSPFSNRLLLIMIRCFDTAFDHRALIFLISMRLSNHSQMLKKRICLRLANYRCPWREETLTTHPKA